MNGNFLGMSQGGPIGWGRSARIPVQNRLFPSLHLSSPGLEHIIGRSDRYPCGNFWLFSSPLVILLVYRLQAVSFTGRYFCALV